MGRKRQASKRNRARDKQRQYEKSMQDVYVERKLSAAEAERRQRAKMVKEKYGQSAYRSCGVKRRYATEQEAIDAIVHRRAPYLMRPYHCPYCDGWHITHTELSDDIVEHESD